MSVFCKNSNQGGGIIVNNKVGGFKFITVYDKFYFYYDQWEVCFLNQYLKKYSHLIYNCSAFGYGIQKSLETYCTHLVYT